MELKSGIHKTDLFFLLEFEWKKNKEESQDPSQTTEPAS